MSDAYVNSVLKYCIGRICKKCGVTAIEEGSLEILVRLLFTCTESILYYLCI